MHINTPNIKATNLTWPNKKNEKMYNQYKHYISLKNICIL